jgi:hypothetical protein
MRKQTLIPFIDGKLPAQNPQPHSQGVSQAEENPAEAKFLIEGEESAKFGEHNKMIWVYFVWLKHQSRRDAMIVTDNRR